MKTAIAAAALAAGLTLAGNAAAFECPAHFAEAQSAIDAATEAMNAMPDEADKGLVHSLIDDAKMWLESAHHNHEKPAAGKFDHARSIAKAHAAQGYAMSAGMMAKR